MKFLIHKKVNATPFACLGLQNVQRKHILCINDDLTAAFQC